MNSKKSFGRLISFRTRLTRKLRRLLNRQQAHDVMSRISDEVDKLREAATSPIQDLSGLSERLTKCIRDISCP